MARRGTETKQRILDQATELVTRQGFGATSIHDLLAGTGVNRGSLYFHFPGKDDLGVAVLERSRKRFVEFLESALVGTTPGRQIENFFRAALKANRDRKFIGGCLWGNTALEMADREADPRYLAVVRDLFRTWRDMLAEVITQAQATGEVRTDLKAKALATTVISSIEGGIMLARLDKRATPLATCLDALRHTLQLKPKPVRAAKKGAAQ